MQFNNYLREMKQSLITIAVTFFFMYLIYMILAYSFQNSAIFPGQYIATYPLESTKRFYPQIKSDFVEFDGNKCEYWYIGEGKDCLLIYAHGNFSLLDHLPDRLDALNKMGIDVLAVEFPGYGRSEGIPTVNSIRKANLTAFKQLPYKYKKIVGYGRSLGGGIILDLSDIIDFDALILESTFADLRNMAYRFILPPIIITTDYDNIERITDYTKPVLIFHGKPDKTVPYSNAELLHNAAKKSELISYNSGHEEGPDNLEKHYEVIKQFLLNNHLLENE